MSDEDLRTLRREATASKDGATWLRVATLLAREGRWDEASAAVLAAEECGADGGEVLESFAPSSFELRKLDPGPARPGARPQLAWSPDGAELFVAEHAPDGTAGIVAWRVPPAPARPRARQVVVNLRAEHVLGLSVNGAGRMLLCYRERGRPTIAFIERGFLQPPLVASHAVFQATLALGHVFTKDGTTVRAYLPGSEDVEWEAEGASIALDATGSVACHVRGRLELRDPFTKKPRRTVPLDETPARIEVARRRAVVWTSRAVLLCAGDALVEIGEPAAAPDHVAVSPSGRHVASFAFGPGTIHLTDARTRETLTFSVGERSGVSAAWSPSGRALAVAKTTGELFLLEGS